jgi:hypothetical protein
MATDADVLSYLTTVDYPASKDDLVRDAERNGAPDEVVKSLRAMPPVTYANKSEVQRSALGTEQPRLRSVDAEQSRLNSTSPIAKGERDV